MIRGNRLLVFIIVLSLASCNHDSRIKPEINNIPIVVSLERFDQEFANTSAADLSKLKIKYPFLFPEQYHDSVWVAKTKDTLQLEINKEVQLAFPSFEQEKEQLELLFKHLKFYFPKSEIPQIITLTNEVSYDNRIVFADSLLLICLDNYLGRDHHFYTQISQYIANQLDKEFLIADVASAITKPHLSYPRQNSFIERLVFYGKELFLVSQLTPWLSPHQHMRYTQEEWQWAVDNEAQIWSYFIENDLLYSSNQDLDRRFLDPAPFSKFGLALDNESPGRLGRFIGWQILTSFAIENPNVPIAQILQMSGEQIFLKSRYKPKK